MKILKKLSALVVAVAIFGSTAMAADVAFDSKLEASADTKQITVNVYAGDRVTSIGMFAAFNLIYNTEVYTFNSTNSVLKYGDELKDNGALGIGWGTSSNIASITDKLICSVVFDVKEGKSPVGTTFSIAAGQDMTMWDADMAVFYTEFDGSITVTEAAGGNQGGESGNTVQATKTEGTNVDEYTFTNSTEMTNKKVLMSKSGPATLTDATKVTITQASTGKTKVFTNILSSVTQGGGSVTVNNVRFGIVVDAGVAASDFTFTIE